MVTQQAARTPRTSAPDEAASGESQLEQLFALSLDLLCVADVSGRLIRANPAWTRVLGYDERELLDRPFIDFVHPNDVATTRRALTTLSGGRTVASFVNRLRTAGGEYRWLSWNATPAPGGVIYAVARDITEKRTAELALQQSEARNRLVARASRDALYDWDIVSGALLFDGSFATTLGYPTTQQHTNIDWWVEGIHPDDRQRVDASLNAAIASGVESWAEEYRFRRGDGTYGEILDRGLLMRDERGVAYRMIGTMADITDRRHLEQQLRQSQKMEAIGRLAGGVAHDFNNLITAITGFSSLLLDDLDESDPRRADVREIARAAERASALTRNLLAFSRRQVLRPRPLDLNAVVRDMENLLRRVIVERVAIVLDLADDIRLVKADQNQIEQVILNLALNARDAMPDGGRLTISTRNVTFASSDFPWAVSPGDYTLITISDTGVGMDAEIRAHLFEPFFTTKAVGSGTGLGLATVYGIVKQSGGHIVVDSALGKGTSFRIYLPHASEALITGEMPAVNGTPVTGRGETILVVDDEDAVRISTQRMLERAGYNVVAAADGTEALRLAREQGTAVGLVVSDVVMPGMDGPEMVKRLRRSHPGIKVIFISGYSEDGVRKDGALEAGTPFLSKPFTRDELEASIRDTLDG